MRVLAKITFFGVVWYIIAGAIIGALARLILPGKQRLSVLLTIGLGIVAAIVGGLLWNAVFPNNDGVAWIGSIIVAVVIVFLYDRFFGTSKA